MTIFYFIKILIIQINDQDECANPSVHLKGMSSETCLIPMSEGGVRPVAKTFGFTTECFFLTHRALDLGYRVVLDKLLRSDFQIFLPFQLIFLTKELIIKIIIF
mgnify:CR=1 FL=1